MSDTYAGLLMSELRLRATHAENEVRRMHKVAARLMQMADAWEEAWGEGGINASLAAEAVRATVRDFGIPA